LFQIFRFKKNETVFVSKKTISKKMKQGNGVKGTQNLLLPEYLK
jgi:hypothetical protein